MGSANKISFKGKKYKSFIDLCNKFNLPESRVRARLKRNWSLGEALEVVFKKSESPGRNKKIVVQGKVYKSIKLACKALSIKNYYTVAQRLNKYNFTIDQAFGFTKPPQKKASNAIKIKIGKKIFSSKKTAAEFYKIDQRLVITRMNRGWTLEEAYGLKTKKLDKNKIYDNSGNKRKGFVYLISNRNNNKKYVGITIGSIQDRFNSHLYQASKKSNKESLEYSIWLLGSDSFSVKQIKKAEVDKLGSLERFYIKKFKTLKPYGYNINTGGAGIFGGKKYDIPLILEGKIFFSLSDVASHLSLNVSTIGARIRSGWNLEKAIKQKVRNIKKIKYKEIEYESKNHLARAFGIPISTMRSRIESGWSISKAINTPIIKKKNTELFPFKYKNKNFYNFSSLAKFVGLKPATLIARLKSGKKLEKIIKEKVKSKKIAINGKEFLTLKEAAKFYKINYNLVLQRINRDKYSIRRALELD
jgi:hypothetical protein